MRPFVLPTILTLAMLAAACDKGKPEPTPKADAVPVTKAPKAEPASTVQDQGQGQGQDQDQVGQPPGPIGESMATYGDVALAKQLGEQILAMDRPALALVVDGRSGDVRAVAQYKLATERAFESMFAHPASTSKPLLFSHAVLHGKLDPNSPVTCTGPRPSEEAKVEEYSCFHQHGPLTVRGAIATSCNIYLNEVIKLLGPMGVEAGLRSFGLAPKKRFEDFSATPLQIATAYRQLYTMATGNSKLKLVLEGMSDTVYAESGSGHSARPSSARRILGKTGTWAPDENEPIYDSWFVALIPSEKDQDNLESIVVTFMRSEKLSPQGAAKLAQGVVDIAIASPPTRSE